MTASPLDVLLMECERYLSADLPGGTIADDFEKLIAIVRELEGALQYQRSRALSWHITGMVSSRYLKDIADDIDKALLNASKLAGGGE